MSIIKSYSLGSGDIRGDMFYIKHNSNSFTVLDCYLTEKDGRIDEIIGDIKTASKDKVIHRFISTHPDNDHIAGIEKLYNEWPWPDSNFYVVQNNIPEDTNNSSLTQYIDLKKRSPVFIEQGLKRAFLNQNGTTKTGTFIEGAGINFLWPDIKNEKFQEALASISNNTNKICPIITYKVYNSATFMWMGDLKDNMQQEYYNNNKNQIPKVDILFAPHHGRESDKVPKELLDKLDPEIIVIGDAPSDNLYYYDSEKTITQNSAGDIRFDCIDGKVIIYTKNKK